MKHAYPDILKLIGHTPLVRLNRLNPNKKVAIWVKIESFNPGGSVKDRIALSMIEAAEKSGALTRDKTIIEATSGNTGIGLAMVAAVKGYPLLLAMPESASVERQKILKAYGAKLLLTPAHQGTDGSIETVYQMAREHPDKYCLLDQFNNPDNIAAHYQGTGSGNLGTDQRQGDHGRSHHGHHRNPDGFDPTAERIESGDKDHRDGTLSGS